MNKNATGHRYRINLINQIGAMWDYMFENFGLSKQVGNKKSIVNYTPNFQFLKWVHSNLRPFPLDDCKLSRW